VICKLKVSSFIRIWSALECHRRLCVQLYDGPDRIDCFYLARIASLVQTCALQKTGPEVMPFQALRNGLVRILPLYSDERVGAASTGAERVRIT
jgi:hypothetical protein